MAAVLCLVPPPHFPDRYHVGAERWQKRASGKGLPDTLIKARPRQRLRECSKGNHSFLSLHMHASPLPPLFLAPLFFFFLPVVSSACCFNSLLITSHVPHKVLISRLPCMGARQTYTQEPVHARTHVRTANRSSSCILYGYFTCTCIFNASALWLHFIIYTWFPWEKVSPFGNINNHTHS